MKITLVIATTILVLSVVGIARANIIQNGGFESPAIAVNSHSQTVPTSWSYGSAAGYILNGNNGNPTVWPSPQSGQQYADAGDDPNLGLFQAVTLTGAGSYAVSWYDNSGYGNGSTGSGYQVEILDSGQNLVTSQIFGANPGFSVSGGGSWRTEGFSFTIGAGGQYTVGFIPQGQQGNTDVLLDDVLLTPAPEPTSTGLLAIGILASLLWRRHDIRQTLKRA